MIATTISTSTRVTPALARRVRARRRSRAHFSSHWVMLDVSFLDLLDAIHATGNAIGARTHQRVSFPGLGTRANQGQRPSPSVAGNAMHIRRAGQRRKALRALALV